MNIVRLILGFIASMMLITLINAITLGLKWVIYYSPVVLIPLAFAFVVKLVLDYAGKGESHFETGLALSITAEVIFISVFDVSSYLFFKDEKSNQLNASNLCFFAAILLYAYINVFSMRDYIKDFLQRAAEAYRDGTSHFHPSFHHSSFRYYYNHKKINLVKVPIIAGFVFALVLISFYVFTDLFYGMFILISKPNGVSYALSCIMVLFASLWLLSVAYIEKLESLIQFHVHRVHICGMYSMGISLKIVHHALQTNYLSTLGKVYGF